MTSSRVKGLNKFPQFKYYVLQHYDPETTLKMYVALAKDSALWNFLI